MAEQTPTTPATPPASGADPQNQNPAGGGEHMIPKTRFDEVNNALKESRAQLQKFIDDQKAAEDKRLKEQGEFKTLAEQNAAKAADFEQKLNAEKAQADQFRAFVQKKREAVKAKMGDRWLELYNQAGLEDLEKLDAQSGQPANVDGRTVNPARPVPKPGDLKVAEMKPDEFQQMVNAAKRGDFATKS